MLTRQSLSHNGAALFAGEGYGGLSEVGLYYVGGLLKHARALSAIVAPTTNSYKRLVAGEAPVLLAYSAHNRAAVCRISERSSCPKAKGVEFRPPDPAANPYLAFAAMLMAGLDGVINQIDPGEALDEDVPWEEMKRVPSMPASLDEALECLEDDSDFLLKSDVFSPDLVETFIEDKRRHESQAVQLRPHPYEFALYFDL
jgi:glutamine synthetase